MGTHPQTHIVRQTHTEGDNTCGETYTDNDINRYGQTHTWTSIDMDRKRYI
jgi:hypothetical protein